MKPLTKLAVTALIAYTPIHILAQAPQTFHITETALGLTTDIPDASVGGTQDHWTITLSGIFQLTGTGTFQISEPEDPSLWNTITLHGPTSLSFDSDVAFNADTSHLTSPYTYEAGIAEQIPNSPGNVIVHTVIIGDVADPVTTPEGSPTVLLFSLTALGLLAAARFQGVPLVAQLHR